ncbi:unnamed protein product [Ostreobium quekettii]|uniref:C3H1-type domain-containing protein n=1 Tax=Ostreobium quekettii TaxID=121088 RepID=A0A8S1J7H4_9CHLO|nr:unnamed protein product [Ostreobium quekettii]
MYVRRGQSLIRVASGALPRHSARNLGHGRRARSEAGALKARGKGGLKHGRGVLRRIAAQRERRKGPAPGKALLRKGKQGKTHRDGGEQAAADFKASLKEMDEAAMRVVAAQTTLREGGKPALRFLDEDPPPLSCLTGMGPASGSCLAGSCVEPDEDEVLSPRVAAGDPPPPLPRPPGHGTEPGRLKEEGVEGSDQHPSDCSSGGLPEASSDGDSACASSRGQLGLRGSECCPNGSMAGNTSHSSGELDEVAFPGSKHSRAAPSTSTRPHVHPLMACSPVVVVGPSTPAATIGGWKSVRALEAVNGTQPAGWTGLTFWSPAALQQGGFVCPVGLMPPAAVSTTKSNNKEGGNSPRRTENSEGAAATVSKTSAGTAKIEGGMVEGRDSGDRQSQDIISGPVDGPESEADSISGSTQNAVPSTSHDCNSNSTYGYKRVGDNMLVRCTDGGGESVTAGRGAGERSERTCRTPCSSSDYGTPQKMTKKRSRTSTPGVEASVSYKRVGNNTLVRYAEFTGSLLGKAETKVLEGRKCVGEADDVAVAGSKPGAGVSKQQAFNCSAKEVIASDSAQHSANRQKGLSAPRGRQELCRQFMRFGSCALAQSGRCRLVHDPDKVAVCVAWLRGQRGLPGCDKAKCPLQHKYRPELMPVCMHFWKGVCYHDPCPYLHSRVDPKAPVCPDFVRGYCPLGASCTKKHFTPRMVEQFEKDQQNAQGGADIWGSFLEWAQQGLGSELAGDQGEFLQLDGQQGAKTVTAGTPT